MAGKSTQQRGMEEAPKNGKKLLHSTHANGMNSSVTQKESTCPIIFPQCFVVFFWTFLVT